MSTQHTPNVFDKENAKAREQRRRANCFPSLLAALEESHCWSCRRRFTDPPAPHCESCIQQRDAIDKAKEEA